MAAMKPRTGDGPLEVTKEGRGYVMRVPLEGGGRLVAHYARASYDSLLAHGIRDRHLARLLGHVHPTASAG